jgi:rhodanese-related sulfurtransferase
MRICKLFFKTLLVLLLVVLLISCEDKTTEPEDTEAPTVAITYPANNAEFPTGSEITIIADATDNEALKEVEFYIDGILVFTDSEDPYHYFWDTQTKRDTDHTIYAKAYDTSDNSAISEVINITITEPVGTAPNPPINPSPSDASADISINTGLSWDCSDPEGDLLTYDIYFGTSSNPPLVSANLSSTSFDPGTLINDTAYYWKIKATDVNNNSTIGDVWQFTTISMDKFGILLDFMNSNGMELDELLNNWIVSASTIVVNLEDYYIMDIRTGDLNQNSTVDYYDGHIPGAVLSSLATITDDASMANNPIIVVDYSGQSASYAVMALRLSGYADARVLKWGMSSWHSDFDEWTNHCTQLNHPNWLSAPGDITDDEVNDYPILDTVLEDGAAILADRIHALLTGGFQSLPNMNVLDNPTNYFINNFWLEEDVETYGNISGSHRIYPLILENLNPNETVVSYGWTGQTTSMLTAYLNVLGYDAKVLRYGVNSIIYDDLTSHNWIGSMDYDYETSIP